MERMDIWMKTSQKTLTALAVLALSQLMCTGETGKEVSDQVNTFVDSNGNGFREGSEERPAGVVITYGTHGTFTTNGATNHLIEFTLSGTHECDDFNRHE